MITVIKTANQQKARQYPYWHAPQSLWVRFAAGCSESDRLTDVLDQLDEVSVNKLAHDYEAGKLAQI
jgi:hypothetical protein